MIEKWFEAFTLLEKSAGPDGMGGEEASWTPCLTFRGALTCVPGVEVATAGQPVLRERPSLLHEFDVTLSPGDHIRREATGAVYRVAGHSNGMRSPAQSGLRFAQVSVERLVIPC